MTLTLPPVSKYLTVHGASVAALCRVQIALVQLHVGSEYVVKKYVFGLLSSSSSRWRHWRASFWPGAFITPPHMRQRASVSVNGGWVIDMIFSDGSQQDVTILLPVSALGAKLVFTFTTPDGVLPKQLGMTTDGRVLGLAVHSSTSK